MRRSGLSTSHGHTLLEALVAASIFSVIVGVGLQQIQDSVQASSQGTVESDLRRIGQDVLGRIAQDLRSTQARLAGATADTLDFTRVASFDARAQSLTLEQDRSGNQVYTRYRSPATLTTPDGRYQILELTRGDAAYMAGTGTAGVRVELSRELAPGGFALVAQDTASPFRLGGAAATNPFAAGVTSLALPGAFTTGHHFADEPVLLAIRLTLARRTGLTASREQYAKVSVQTEVQLRASY